MCVSRADLDAVDEADVVPPDGFQGPDERRVRLGLLLLSLLHATHGLPEEERRSIGPSPTAAVYRRFTHSRGLTWKRSAGRAPGSCLTTC